MRESCIHFNSNRISVQIRSTFFEFRCLKAQFFFARASKAYKQAFGIKPLKIPWGCAFFSWFSRFTKISSELKIQIHSMKTLGLSFQVFFVANSFSDTWPLPRTLSVLYVCPWVAWFCIHSWHSPSSRMSTASGRGSCLSLAILPQGEFLFRFRVTWNLKSFLKRSFASTNMLSPQSFVWLDICFSSTWKIYTMWLFFTIVLMVV